MAITTKYVRGKNAGNMACSNCGRLTWYERWFNQAGLCEECYALAGKENTLLDQGKDAEAAIVNAEFNARYEKYGKAGPIP